MDHQAKIGRIAASMREDGLDALVITRTGGIAYVSGVLAPWRTAIVISEGDVELITVRNDVARVLDLTWIERHRTWEMADPDGFSQAVVDALRGRGLDRGRIGVDLASAQHPGALSASEYLRLTQDLPDVQWMSGMKALDSVMVVKEHGEIELLRRAAELADLGMDAAFAAIAPGRTELEVAGVAEAAMRSAGNEFVWSVTGTEVGSGYRQRYELGFTVAPSTKRIQRGDIVTVDVHPMVGCYLGDLALNAVVGQPTSEQRALERAWKATADTIFERVREGAVISEIARAAYATASEHGYGDHTIPFFGHGLGTDARIPPTITEANDSRLEAGMVFEVLVQTTVPRVGGLRLETAILVTEDGYEDLNRTPIELRVLDC